MTTLLRGVLSMCPRQREISLEAFAEPARCMALPCRPTPSRMKTGWQMSSALRGAACHRGRFCDAALASSASPLLFQLALATLALASLLTQY